MLAEKGLAGISRLTKNAAEMQIQPDISFAFEIEALSRRGLVAKSREAQELETCEGETQPSASKDEDFETISSFFLK